MIGGVDHHARLPKRMMVSDNYNLTLGFITGIRRATSSDKRRGAYSQVESGTPRECPFLAIDRKAIAPLEISVGSLQGEQIAAPHFLVW